MLAYGFDSAISQEHPRSGSQASELNTTLSLLPNKIALNQEMEIIFNISNKDLGYKTKAKNITFMASLSKSLAMPGEEIRTEKNECKQNNSLEICGSNFKSGDYALVKPDGTIIIWLANLSSKENKIIKYKTIYIQNGGQSGYKICSNVFFDWDRKMAGVNGPFIPEIRETNNKIKSFNVNISPEHNITFQDDKNCTVFKNSRVSFSSNLDENKHNISYKDIKLGVIPLMESIDSGDLVSDLGKHQFSIEVFDSEDISYMNSSRYYEVVDLIDYHRNLINIFNIFGKDKITIYPAFFILLFICYIILYYLRRIEPCGASKCKTKNNTNNICVHLENHNVKIKLFLIIILIQLFLYYYYFCLVGVYKSLICLEAASAVAAFALLNIYIYYDNMPCKLQFIKMEDGFPFAFFILTIIFHWILPDIPIILVTFIFLVLVDFILLILGKSQKESDNISMQQILWTIVLLILIIVIAFISKVPFKTSFEPFELFIIELMEISFLISVSQILFHLNNILRDYKKLGFPQRALWILEKFKSLKDINAR